MGRVRLAGMDDEAMCAFLDSADLEPLTDRTVTDRGRVRELVRRTRADGWAIVDQELERGLRSLAVPLRNRDGATVAALNVCAATSRVSTDEMRRHYLPATRQAAAAITTAWSRHPGGALRQL